MWKPISEAPRDKTKVDLSDGNYRLTDCFWAEADGTNPGGWWREDPHSGEHLVLYLVTYESDGPFKYFHEIPKLPKGE